MNRIKEWLYNSQFEEGPPREFLTVKELCQTDDYATDFPKLIELAKAKNIFAQHALGLMYADGDGVKQDDVEATRWFRLAAEEKYTPAQYNLGKMYEEGRGVAKDYGEAVDWYRIAADEENAEAQCKLGMMFDEGKCGVLQNYVAAAEWYKRAMEKGSVEAKYRLGVMYQNGRGVELDDEKVAEYIIEAAKAGSIAAQNHLGEMLREKKDYLYAYMWFNIAAALGHEEARESRDDMAKKHMDSENILEAQEMSEEEISNIGP